MLPRSYMRDEGRSLRAGRRTSQAGCPKECTLRQGVGHVQRARRRHGNVAVEKLKKRVIILDIFIGR